MADETLREKAARETAEGVGRKCFDEPLLRAFGLLLHPDEDEHTAWRALELERMQKERSCSPCPCEDCDGSA